MEKDGKMLLENDDKKTDDDDKMVDTVADDPLLVDIQCWDCSLCHNT